MIRQSKLPKRCCYRCQFFEKEEWNNGWTEDWPGHCHRSSPAPTIDGYWYALMELFSQLTWPKWPREMKFPNWEEPEEWVTWPKTHGNDWCGDFKQEMKMPSKNVIKKFSKGQLHSGSKKGPVVTNPKQAKAIAASEARAEKKRKRR